MENISIELIVFLIIVSAFLIAIAINYNNEKKEKKSLKEAETILKNTCKKPVHDGPTEEEVSKIKVCEVPENKAEEPKVIKLETKPKRTYKKREKK